MRTWILLRARMRCRHCGCDLKPGEAVLEIGLPQVKRKRYACASCAKVEWQETEPDLISEPRESSPTQAPDFSQFKDLAPVLKRRWIGTDNKSKAIGDV